MIKRPCRSKTILSLTLLLLPVTITAGHRGGQRDPDAGKVVVYRDEYGVPHIYAPTIEGGLYAMGYAEAEDRLEELLKNYMRAMGEMAGPFGASELVGDIHSHIFRHYDIARKNYSRIRPEVRSHIAAFVEGVNDYMNAHRNKVPSWWGYRKVDVYMVVAHSRQFMWGWPTGQALEELRRAGVMPNLAADLRSSNEMAIAPSRTSVAAPILIIDPHLSWWGAQRFWEFRIHAGVLHGSGFTLPGSPYIGLGHNDNVAWAMTTGGPDTADVYVLQLNPVNPLQYKYDGTWRDLTPREESIAVKGDAKPRKLTVYDSHYGPVVARREKEAYAAKLSYADEVQFDEAFYLFNMARNIEDFKKGLDLNQIMPQNVMVADTSGNIYYQRAGRVPVRPDGFDFFRPVDGSTSKSEWLGIHPASDLIAIENPAQGYMQNCNIPPDVMMRDSPLTPDKFKGYIFNASGGRTSQRAARAVDLLEANSHVTPEKAQAIALDDYCYQYDRWTAALKQADEKVGAVYKSDADYQAGLADILAWDGFSHSDSRGALKFYYWRHSLRTASGFIDANLVETLTDFMAAVGRPQKGAPEISDTGMKGMVDGLSSAMRTMRSDLNTLDRTYGDVFRVGRDDKSWPVSGGSLIEEGMATLRAIAFEKPRADHTRWGTSGQTSTQVVVLTKPVRSWTQPPTGQSDYPDSPFYRDQAEKLFSKAKMKPTWYEKSELLRHVYRRAELNYPSKPAVN